MERECGSNRCILDSNHSRRWHPGRYTRGNHITDTSENWFVINNHCKITLIWDDNLPSNFKDAYIIYCAYILNFTLISPFQMWWISKPISAFKKKGTFMRFISHNCDFIDVNKRFLKYSLQENTISLFLVSTWIHLIYCVTLHLFCLVIQIY